MRNLKILKAKRPKTVLRLLDLEHSKSAVLNSLAAVSSQKSYGHAIDEFIAWCCSEPRLSFSRIVVLRYRIHLEQKHLASSTINVRLAAVRRLAYEAADNGILSPELAAGIRRVKGAKHLGVRVGNWLTIEQARVFLDESCPETLRGKRDRAIICILLGCGLRRGEIVDLTIKDLQVREGHWVVADLVGKGNHIRTVPVPSWVKTVIDEWVALSGITEGKMFRRINKNGKVWGNQITAKTVWYVVKSAARVAGIPNIAPHDLRRYAECPTMPNLFRRNVAWCGFDDFATRSDSA